LCHIDRFHKDSKRKLVERPQVVKNEAENIAHTWRPCKRIRPVLVDVCHDNIKDFVGKHQNNFSHRSTEYMIACLERMLEMSAPDYKADLMIDFDYYSYDDLVNPFYHDFDFKYYPSIAREPNKACIPF